MILLDNSMFDNGSIQCRTFVLATANDVSFCEFDTIEKMFHPDTIAEIKSKLNADLRYINVSKQGITTDCELILEIQWD